MNAPRSPRFSSTHPAEQGGGWRARLYLAAGLTLVACGIYYLWSTLSNTPELRDTPVASNTTSRSTNASGDDTRWPWDLSTDTGTTKPPSSSPQTPNATHTEGDADPTADLSSHVPRGATPTMNEVIERLHQAGIRTGLAAFNPPGTKPPLVGLAVPEGFPLPDGYVRHYQSTDDGQNIEPILMYAPDRKFVDASGQPITVPEDRVVPPELAPAGLPIRKVVIPAPTEARSAGL